jgi:hypothetical protein
MTKPTSNKQTNKHTCNNSEVVLFKIFIEEEAQEEEE